MLKLKQDLKQDRNLYNSLTRLCRINFFLHCLQYHLSLFLGCTDKLIQLWPGRGRWDRRQPIFRTILLEVNSLLLESGVAR